MGVHMVPLLGWLYGVDGVRKGPYIRDETTGELLVPSSGGRTVQGITAAPSCKSHRLPAR